jgi:hypothetical protein
VAVLALKVCKTKQTHADPVTLPLPFITPSRNSEERTKFVKGDQVRVHATKSNGIIDELGLRFSERWTRDGHGEWCYGKISLVYKKKIGRQPQKYRILYHEGTSMVGIEADIERAPENDLELSVSDPDDARTELQVDDREEDSPYSDECTTDGTGEDDDDEEEVQGVNRVRARRKSSRQVQDIQEESGNEELEDSDSDNDEKDEVKGGGVVYQVGKRKRKEDADTQDDRTDLKVGDTVQVGSMTWERIEGLDKDSRTVPHFDTKFKSHLFNDETTEADVFRALMPISKTGLLKIVRQNAEDDNDRRPWVGWHIDAALAIIFGGAQFKEGTDLWATQRVGLMPPPDFGRFLSKDRFQRIL